MHRALPLLVCCGVLGLAETARADVSSWAYVGGGTTTFKMQDTARRTDASIAVETGIGTAASHPVVVGGLFKLNALLRDGADLGLSLRVATRGFVTGAFGLALDAGPYQRFWGAGSSGGQAALVLGAPWGLTLSLGGGIGTNSANQFGATLGLDFARLTVYRLSGENWFPNPHPAFRPKE